MIAPTLLKAILKFYFSLVIDFVSEMPLDCLSFHPPHSVGCLVALWLSTGCVQSGYDYPTNLSKSDAEFISTLDARLVYIFFSKSIARVKFNRTFDFCW